jgi:hypothetical protein
LKNTWYYSIFIFLNNPENSMEACNLHYSVADPICNYYFWILSDSDPNLELDITYNRWTKKPKKWCLSYKIRSNKFYFSIPMHFYFVLPVLGIRIWIIDIKMKWRYRIRIGIKIKNGIRIRIKMVLIRNTASICFWFFLIFCEEKKLKTAAFLNI